MKKPCYSCGKKLTKINSAPYVVRRGYGHCRECSSAYQRQWHGWNPLNRQLAGRKHTFPCGCSGILPDKKGESNQFAHWMTRNWVCRVGSILISSKMSAGKHGYAPIKQNTAHSIIRDFMASPDCERCKKPLLWEFGKAKTPHLHHNHETGDIYGFTHPRCNFRDLEIEIERLKDLLKIGRRQKRKNGQ